MPTANPSATPADRPVGAADLAALFRRFEGCRGILLAVSGGADSTAMMLLAARWRQAGGDAPLMIATLDHRLRHGSAAEGDLVAAQAAGLGLPCRRLAWAEASGGSRLQERARAARYHLLSEAAREAGCDAIATAHTLDDQAETVLMRALRGSGIDGLAAMRPETDLAGLRHLRPFLAMPKTRLVATLRDAGWRWSEDPSNSDPRHERVRLRALLAGLDPAAPARLAQLALRSQRAAQALDGAAQALVDRAGGHHGVDAAMLASAPAELRLRALAMLLADTGIPVRLDRLERLADDLAEAVRHDRPFARTLQGHSIRLRQGRLVIAPELERRSRRVVNHVPDQRLHGAAMPWQDPVAPLD